MSADTRCRVRATVLLTTLVLAPAAAAQSNTTESSPVASLRLRLEGALNGDMQLVGESNSCERRTGPGHDVVELTFSGSVPSGELLNVEVRVAGFAGSGPHDMHGRLVNGERERRFQVLTSDLRGQWTIFLNTPSAGTVTVDPGMSSRVLVDVVLQPYGSGYPTDLRVLGTIFCERPIGDVEVAQPVPTEELPATGGADDEEFDVDAPGVDDTLAAGEDPDVDPSALRGFVDGRRVRTALAAAVRKPSEIPWTVEAVAVSAVVAVALLLVLFPAQLFNATLEEHYDEIVGWLPWRRGRPPPAERSHQWIGLLAVAMATAGLAQLLDPHVRLDRATATGVGGAATAVVVLSVISGAPTRLWLHRKYRTRSTLRAYPAALVVAVACVALSRALGFEPGYLYGIVGGFVMAAAVSDRDAGRSSAFGTLFGLALAAAAWLAHGRLLDRAESGATGWLVADAFLAAVYGGALGGLIFGLVPLRFLPGGTIAKWSRTAWAALFGFAVFGFVHTLLTPDVGERESVLVTTALFAGFGVASTAFWAYFRFRPARESELRVDSVATAEDAEPAVRAAVLPEPTTFPPPGWEELTVREVREFLPAFDLAQLTALRDAELAGKNRASLLRDISAQLRRREGGKP